VKTPERVLALAKAPPKNTAFWCALKGMPHDHGKIFRSETEEQALVAACAFFRRSADRVVISRLLP
jgi:hypothetical protein